MSAANEPTGITADSMFQSPRSCACDTALVIVEAGLSEIRSAFSQLDSAKTADIKRETKYLQYERGGYFVECQTDSPTQYSL